MRQTRSVHHTQYVCKDDVDVNEPSNSICAVKFKLSTSHDRIKTDTIGLDVHV